jgi:hypothetical protein
MVTITELSPVRQPGLQLLPAESGRTLSITIVGNCDMESIHLLDSFLSAAHAHAVRAGKRWVEFDCDGLYFMNSSSLKSFVMYLNKVKRTPPEDRYAVHFKTNPKLGWQRRNLEALRRFAIDLVSID